MPFNPNFRLFTAVVTGLIILATPSMAERTKETGRVWTINEILTEAEPEPVQTPIDYCQGGRFSPCVCWEDVSRDVRYRPSVRECRGRAAIILSGKYRGVFSVVVRDTENRDRFPASGFGGCSSYERDTLGLNKCSAFKVQRRFAVGEGKQEAVVHCLGASGYSPLFKRVVRVTAKLADVPDSSDDPLVRWCLRRSRLPLN